MKKLLFSLLIFCLNMQSSAQIPVTDVASNTTQVTNQIVNGTTWTNQLFQLQQQASILTTTLKYVQEVSSAVRDVAYAKYLIERQFKIIDDCSRMITRADKLDVRLVVGVERNVLAFLATNTSLVTLITSTLTTRFKMDDSGRLSTLMALKNEQLALLRDLYTLDLIISTSMATSDIIEFQLLR